MIGGVHLPAVLVSAIAGLVINFVWFTILFRAPYIAALGRTKEQLAAGPSVAAASALQFLGFMAMSYGLAWLMGKAGMTSIAGGVTLATVAWVAFVAAIIGPTYAYQAFPSTLFGIVAGGYLIVLLASGAILGAWR